MDGYIFIIEGYSIPEQYSPFSSNHTVNTKGGADFTKETRHPTNL